MAVLFGIQSRRTFRLGRTITDPITKLCGRVREISSGDLSPHIPAQTDQYEIESLSRGFEQIVVRLNAQIEQTRREQAQLYRTELALLQAQINPHFLYNTLDNTISVWQGIWAVCQKHARQRDDCYYKNPIPAASAGILKISFQTGGNCNEKMAAGVPFACRPDRMPGSAGNIG